MILIYYKTWIYQCPIIQVKSPSIYMVSRPGLGSDSPIGSDRDSGRDECVLDLKGSWEEHLPLVEFAYNNSYQTSIQMAPYEALYGRSCRSPICWTEVGESSITGSNLIKDTSAKVGLIQKRLLMAQSQQKSYANKRSLPLEFEVGDHVFLKVMPKRGVVRFGK